MNFGELKRYRYYAFISYSHNDMALARWLHRKLENFRLPVRLQNEIKQKSRYLRPVFRDLDDLNTGILNDELQKNLDASKFLIVICSKSSAASQWVSAEIDYFIHKGGFERIIPVVIPEKGVPQLDLLPAALKNYIISNPERELLCINIAEGGRHKAFIRIVSRMLGVSFDTLWKRHQRRKAVNLSLWALSSIALLSIIYLFAIPVYLTVRIEREPSSLPAAGEINLSVDNALYAASSLDDVFSHIKIPGYRRFDKVSLKAESQYFIPVDTQVYTGFSVNKHVELRLKRDDTFALFQGEVFDENLVPLEGVTIRIDTLYALTGPDGKFTLKLPLELQKTEQTIRLEKNGYRPHIREDENPGTYMKFMLKK